MHTEQHFNVKATLFVVVSAILYGFLGYLGTSIINENISIANMLFWRFLIASLWILFFVLRTQGKRAELKQISKRTFLFMFVLGAVGYVGSSGFYFMASHYTGTGLAMVIFFSYPIIIALASWLIYRKKLNRVTIIALVAMIIGLALLRDSTAHTISFLGIFYALLAAAGYSFYIMGSKHTSSVAIDSAVLTWIVCCGCTVVFLVLVLVNHSFILPTSINSWIYILALGILVTAVPIQLMLIGLKHISAMRASIISVLEPLVTVFVGILLLNETISHTQMLGAIIILVSALWVQFYKKL